MDVRCRAETAQLEATQGSFQGPGAESLAAEGSRVTLAAAACGTGARTTSAERATPAMDHRHHVQVAPVVAVGTEQVGPTSPTGHMRALVAATGPLFLGPRVGAPKLPAPRAADLRRFRKCRQLLEITAASTAVRATMGATVQGDSARKAAAAVRTAWQAAVRAQRAEAQTPKVAPANSKSALGSDLWLSKKKTKSG